MVDVLKNSSGASGVIVLGWSWNVNLKP